MNTYSKAAISLFTCYFMLLNQVLAYLPPISFESPSYYANQVLGTGSGTDWSLLSGKANVSPSGTGFGGGQALKLVADPRQESVLTRQIDWDAAETTAFIDFQLKPAADPEGSYATFHANGTQLAFQIPQGGNIGEIWCYNGSGGIANAAQWAKTVGTFALAANGLTAANYTRITLRHDYKRDVWDLFLGGKLAAANLSFEERGVNLEKLDFYGSKVGDTLIDNLSAQTVNMLFSDADKDGLPDTWENANGSNPNLYDRDNLKPATGKSFLDLYMDSLWSGGLNSKTALPPQTGVSPLTILGSHQPVTSIKGSLSVGGDGSATYSLPIDIPKGTAGMEPKISLNYSSSGGNGIAGIGWSLGGLQSITRGAASAAKDGFGGAVRFDGDDRFFFNGEKLVCVAGVYGQENSEYRTEIDSFARITLKGGNQNETSSWWQVETKAGLIIQLGNSNKSKIVSVLYNAPISWDVSQVADTLGNYYSVKWEGQANFTTNKVIDRRVISIDYTGNVNGLTPYSSIVFNYEDRPDKSFAYHTCGLLYETNSRLKEIEVNTGTYNNHSYFLNYEVSTQTGRSILISAYRQHAGGYKTNPTIFTWQGTNATGPKWQKPEKYTLKSYHDSFDSSNRDITSFAETTSNAIRLEGAVGRLVARSPAIVVNNQSYVEFEFRADNLDRGAYLVVDTDKVWNGGSEFVIHLRPDATTSSPISSDRSLTYGTAENSEWKTYRVPLQDSSGAADLLAGSYPYLAFINYDQNVNNGISWSEFRNVRFGSAAELDNNQVSAVGFPKISELPQFSGSTNSTCGMRFMDLNNDGLLDLTDYRVTQWRMVDSELTTESEADVIGGVYLNSGSGFSSDEEYKPIGRYAFTDTGQDDSWSARHDLTAVPCDINGDGKMDLFVTDNRRAYNSYTSINKFKFLTHNGTSWVRLSGYSPHFESRNNTSSTSRGGKRHLLSRDLIDIDRDGYLDLYITTTEDGWLANADTATTLPTSAKILNESSSTVFLNRCHLGQGWVQNDALAPPEDIRFSDDHITYDIGRSLMDLNGDGYLDYVKSTADVTNTSLLDTRYTGRFISPTSSRNLPTWLSAFPDQDFPDWKFPAASYPSTTLMSRSDPQNADRNAPLIQNPDTALRKGAGTQMMDVNGDGLPDIVRGYARLFNSNTKIELSHATWFNRGDTLPGVSRWRKDASVYGEGYTLPLSLDSQAGVEQPCVQFVDLNGDGLVDILYSRDGKDYVGPDGVRTVTADDPFGGTNNGAFINTGTEWVQDQSWGLPDGFKLGANDKPDPASLVVDVNGDGFSDIVAGIRNGERPVIYLNQSKPEVITAITDGFDAELTVDYRRLNDPTPTAGFGTRVYEKFTGSLPTGQAAIIDNRLVVSRYAEEDGLGGRKWKSQRYGDLRYDKKNEASLGFGWVEALDESNGQLTRTDNSRVFPFGGSSLITRTSVLLTAADIAAMPPNRAGCPAFTVGRKDLAIETASYAQMPSQSGIGGVIRRPVQVSSTKHHFDLDGTLKTETVTTQALGDFDAYGFVKKSTVTTLDDTTLVSQNVYTHTTTGGKWHLGRLATSSVTKSGRGLSPVTKSSTFSYNSSTGLLVSETVEPSSPLSVKTTYTHDDFGNVEQTSVTANAGATSGGTQTRSKSTQYDSRGRFVTAEVDNLAHTTLYRYDQAKAQLTSTTDINGLTSFFRYDPFGTLIETDHPDDTKTGEITGYASNLSVPSSVIGLLPNHSIKFFRAMQSSGAPISTVYLDSLGRELVTVNTILLDANSSSGARYGTVYTVKRYDSQGRNFQVSEPFLAGEAVNFTTISYDLLSRVVKTMRPGNLSDAVLEAGSCVLGDQPTTYSKTRNTAGQILERWEDQHGRLLQSKDPSGQTTTFDYDLEGRMTSVEIGSQTLLSNRFDLLGNKISVTEVNSGSSSSVYNGFGEVVSAKNAKGQVTSFVFDQIGRVTSVTNPEGTYTTAYSSASGASLGKPLSITGSGLAAGYQETFSYDSLGRPISTSKTQFGETFTTSTVYDSLGRVAASTNAGGLTVINSYDPTYSFLVRQNLAPGTYEGAGTVLWQAGTYDSKGRMLTQTLAQGISNRTSYNPINGDVTAISSTRASNTLQNKAYQWDTLGNLTSRTDNVAKRVETFVYDSLNRLRSSSVSVLAGANVTTVPPPQTYTYANNGNLLTKGSSASLAYNHATRIHAVTSATVKGAARSYQYDAAGYVVSDGKRSFQWTSFGQLERLEYAAAPELRDLTGSVVSLQGRVVSEFEFDAGGNRASQLKERISTNDSRQIERTLYLGSYERETHSTKTDGDATAVITKVVHRHTLGGGMVYTRTTGGSSPGVKLMNVLADHLGSTDVILTGKWTGSAFTNQTTEFQSFDAWGERRDASTQVNFRATDTDAFRSSANSYDRGYTGHEQLDESGLIHMNGRIYDPELGRFLSPDPVVQIPEYSQNFNRYSYVMNNPLNATDPSGFSWLSKVFHNVGSFIKENWRTIVVIVVVAAVTWGVGSAFISAGSATFTTTTAGVTTLNAAGMAATGAIAGAAGGGLSAALAGGGLGDVLRGAVVGGIQGAITAGLGGNVGAAFDTGKYGLAAAYAAGHGIVGGTINVAMGGKFQDGFIISAATAGAQAIPFGNGSYTAGLLKASVVGGTVNSIGGQKFANGAYTAAFQYLLSEGLANIGKQNSVKMVYPEGGSQNFADYEDKTFGITGMGQDAQSYANKYGIPYLMYDKSGFQFSELFYAGLQKISFGLLDFKGAQATSIFKELGYNGPVNVEAHSQGALIANRMMAGGAFASGSTINMQGPAANYFTSSITAGLRGYHLNYNQVHGDWIGFVNFPNLNLTKNLSAFGAILNPNKHMTGYGY